MTSPSSHFDPIREPRDLLPEIVGKRNADYYLARFDELERSGTFMPSWNWAAFFFGCWWLLYRQMYLFAFVGSLAIALLGIWLGTSSAMDDLMIPLFRLYRIIFVEELLQIYGLIYVALAHVAFPLAANFLYYRHAMGQAERQLRKPSEPDADSRTVEEKPETPASPFRFGWSVVVLLFVGVGIGANVMMFADGKARKKHMERESPALIAALKVFKESNGAYPEKLEQLVPDYIDSLPSCSPRGTKPIAYQRRLQPALLHLLDQQKNLRFRLGQVAFVGRQPAI